MLKDLNEGDLNLLLKRVGGEKITNIIIYLLLLFLE